MTNPEHLTMTLTGRGFAQLPALHGAARSVVRLWESSSAEAPHIWITAEDGGPQGTAHLPIDVARKFAEQILWLCDNHYQLPDDSPP